MKKPLLFLTVFLFFAFLIAEEVQGGESGSGNENEVGKGSENVSGTGRHSELPEWKTAYDSFYFQPTVGAGTGFLSIIRENANLDFYFNVKHTKHHNNIYLGLGTGAYFAPVWSNFFEFPFYGSVVFDFTTRRSKVLKSASLWIEAGYLMIYWRAHKSIFGIDIDNTLFHWFIFGIGTDLLFKHNIVLRIGFENGEVLIPTFAVALGYRF